jgi:hypothetical protein
MPDLKVPQRVWDNLKAAADRRGKKPDALARQALSEFLDRLANEELLAESEKAARRTPFRLKDTEEVIRKYRRQRS